MRKVVLMEMLQKYYGKDAAEAIKEKGERRRRRLHHEGTQRYQQLLQVSSSTTAVATAGGFRFSAVC